MFTKRQGRSACNVEKQLSAELFEAVVYFLLLMTIFFSEDGFCVDFLPVDWPYAIAKFEAKICVQ